MRKSVLINHTWDENKGEAKWLFWLQKQLEALGVDVRIQALDKRDFKKNWFQDIQKLYSVQDEHVYSIQHDPGCITILTYIKYLKDNEISDTHLLVAGNTGVDAHNQSYIRLESPKEIAIFRGEDAAQKNSSMKDAHLVILYSADSEQLQNSKFKSLIGAR